LKDKNERKRLTDFKRPMIKLEQRVIQHSVTDPDPFSGPLSINEANEYFTAHSNWVYSLMPDLSSTRKRKEQLSWRSVSTGIQERER
jgi:hypothetical protein